MKRLAYLTIPLIAALLTSGGAYVLAEDGGTIYPADGEFVRTMSLTSLNDYAVDGDVYAFADGRSVKVFDGEKCTEYAFESDVTALDIKGDEIYCGLADGSACTASDKTACEYVFAEKQSEVLYDGCLYFTDGDGTMCVFDKSTKNTLTYEGKYSNLKLSGEVVYAAAGNKLYAFTKTACSEVTLSYTDYSPTRQIAVGGTAGLLKSFSSVKFVEIAAGTYMTAVDLEKLDGEHFTAGDTVKVDETTTALLLCYTGNAAVVSIGNASYVLLKEKTTETEVDCIKEKPFENAQMLGGMVYASPFVVSGTVSASNATSQIVKIVNAIEYENVLESVFYEVEYTVDGQTVKGYVAKGFLSEYIIEDNKTPNYVQDPEYSESNDTKTILIIFAVVLLLLAAIGYVSYLSANGKRKKKRKNKEKEAEE